MSGGTCTLQPYNPVANDGQSGAVIVNGGDAVTLTGPTQFAPGQNGGDGQQPLRDFSIVEAHGNLDRPELNRGAQNTTATYNDPITGTQRTVNVYDSTNFVAPLFGDRPTTSIVGVGDNQYIDARVATVESSGGTLVVNIVGDINIAAKQTTLFEADGSGLAGTHISWSSSNSINLHGAVMPSLGSPIVASSSVLAGWPVTVTLPDGDFTITNIDDYKAFNDKLILLIQAGLVDQAQYDAFISQGANLDSGTIEYQYPQPTPPDDIYEAVGLRTVIRAIGANASATIEAGANLVANGANGGVLRAEDGALVVNSGIISSTNGRVMVLSGGSTGRNDGIINSGSGSYGVEATGSIFTNNGIINQAVANSSGGGGVAIRSVGSTTVNYGIINLGTAASSGNVSATAVDVTGGSFTNAAGGMIYIGRGTQSDPSAPAADVALNIGGSLTGINVHSNSTVRNEGDIVIGSLTQGAVGLRVDGASDVIVTNIGTIVVAGSAGGTPRENIGFLVRNSGTGSGDSIRNDGAITIQGVNGTGLKVLGDGAGASVTSTGPITVAGGADPDSGTRNIGVWIEGLNGGTATADISGPLSLTGVGAIGVHARGNATVNVSTSASPSFANGTDQIGFFIYGLGASIHTDVNAFEVGTERSTLFRIADGAQFDGSGYTIIASGVSSVGIVGTGSGTIVQTAGSVFDLTGLGATALIIEGGAIGYTDATTLINLDAANTIAGIVDGQKHDLSGNPIGAPDTLTRLQNGADIVSSQTGATGFIARNLGTLDTVGDIALSGPGSVGILAEDSGRVIVNGSQITVDGWAMRAQRGSSNSFTLSGALVEGTSGLLDVTESAGVTFTSNGSTLTGRILTEAGSTSSVSLMSGTIWNMTADSNVTTLANLRSSIVFTPPTDGSFKTLTAASGYSANNGQIVLNTTLNDASVQLTDKLIVGGNTSGTTALIINNVGGLGAVTVGDGIQVVQVDGLSAGRFASPTLFAGAYQYNLFLGGIADPSDGDWYLRSSLSTSSELLGAYAHSLLKYGADTIGTLQQRTGNRLWGLATSSSPNRSPSQETRQASDGVVAGGGWGRLVGLRGRETPETGATYDRDMWFGQTGIEGTVLDLEAGALMAGIMVTFGGQSVDFKLDPNPSSGASRFGKISTDSYGAGFNVTWIGMDGLYVDGVGQYTWYSSDLFSSDTGSVANDNRGRGYALSLELGKRYAGAGGWAIVPQGQLIYSSVDFDNFLMSGTTPVSLGDGDSLLGRIGLRLEQLSIAKDAQRYQFYGIANLTYEFLEGTSVNIDATTLDYKAQPLWGELGGGLTYALGDKVNLYAEGSYATSLNSFGDSYNYRGNVGLRINW